MSLRLFWEYHRGLCQVSVHREGVNPSSMEGVKDLRDLISVNLIYLGKERKKLTIADS